MKILITENKRLLAINWICEKFKKHNSDYVKDIEILDKGFNDINQYGVKIIFYSGPDSKFWPLTQSKRNRQDDIANKLWDEIYNMIKEPVSLYLQR